jgi:hypothetical protein
MSDADLRIDPLTGGSVMKQRQSEYAASITRRRAELAGRLRDLSKTPLSGTE